MSCFAKDKNYYRANTIKRYAFIITESHSKRNMGGRRPKSSANISPEEEEKRRVRRERNKLAAARCRKRRVDQTNDLMGKVLVLESEKNKLQRDIQDLQAEKEDLECLLQSHRNQCKIQIGGLSKVVEIKSKLEFKEPTQMPLIGKIKLEVDDPTYEDATLPNKHLISDANPVIGAITNPTINSGITCILKQIERPRTLNVPFPAPPSQSIGIHKNIADIAGVKIREFIFTICFEYLREIQVFIRYLLTEIFTMAYILRNTSKY